MKAAIAVLAAATCLGGCSTVFEGTSQEITINTNPSGANCAVMREGVSIGRVNPTPGITTIRKTKYDLSIVCNKEGYQEATARNHSDAAGATAADVLGGLFLAPIFWGIDSATGADNKYDSVVNITLLPKGVTAASAAPAGTSGAPAAAPTTATAPAATPMTATPAPAREAPKKGSIFNN
jgi:hypothetical protein